MKKMLLWQQRPAYAFTQLKKHITGHLYLGLFLILTFTFAGCNDPGCDPPGPGQSNCNTMVTVKSAVCASGIWGSYWLQLDNGEFLQPWESNLNLPQQVKEGQRFLIGFEEVTRDSRYNNAVICQALPPDGKAIRITCMEPADENACSTEVTVEEIACFPGYWGDFWLRKDNGEYLLPYEGMLPNQPLVNGQRLRIGYQTSTANRNYNYTCATLVAVPPAEHINITCLETINPPICPTGACTVLATAEEIECYGGLWGNMWLKLPDGSYLQPWETNITLPATLVKGQQYQLGYEVVANVAMLDPLALCNNYIPATAIRITCFRAAN